MDESDFKTKLRNEIEARYPGAIVTHLDPQDIQGIPDLIVLYKKKWATLEGKISKTASYRPNQEHYIEEMDKMSFSSVVYPENKDEVLTRLDAFFKPKRRRT